MSQPQRPGSKDVPQDWARPERPREPQNGPLDTTQDGNGPQNEALETAQTGTFPQNGPLDTTQNGSGSIDTTQNGSGSIDTTQNGSGSIDTTQNGSGLDGGHQGRGYLARLARVLVEIAFRPAAVGARMRGRASFLRYGVGGCLVMGVLYTITVLVGYLHGFGAVWEPWLPIPAEEYYLWETFFIIPVYFLVFATAAGVMQLLARGLGGAGSFEDTFAVVALGSIVPTVVLMWLPETFLLVFFPGLRAEQLGGFSFLPPWADALRQLVVPVWTVAVYTSTLMRTQSLSAFRSLGVVLVGMVPSVLLTLVFVR
jgi:hypothetical protein